MQRAVRVNNFVNNTSPLRSLTNAQNNVKVAQTLERLGEN